MNSPGLALGHATYGRCVAGIDEAGRGPLAGPVMAAAVVLDPSQPIEMLDDSKRLTPERREDLAAIIRERARAWCVAQASVEEIDQRNILQATFLAMQRAVSGLTTVPDHALVDGKLCPHLDCDTTPVVKGDATYAEIAAASILAKVARDEVMVALDQHYPDYGFRQHKGYPTRAHVQSLRRLGASPAHRRSFAPVRALLGAPAEPQNSQ